MLECTKICDEEVFLYIIPLFCYVYCMVTLECESQEHFLLQTTLNLASINSISSN